MERTITTTVEIDWEIGGDYGTVEVEKEIELDEYEYYSIFRDSLEEWTEYGDTDAVMQATGINEFADVPSVSRWDNSNFFETWLIKTFGNRDTRDASEIVHEFIGNWAEANGFERPAKSHDDADWVADWVTQFMGEPKKCCSNCSRLCDGECTAFSWISQPEESVFMGGIEGDRYSRFVPYNQDESVCDQWEGR